MDKRKKHNICSFCGTENKNKEMMVGINAAICDSCIDIYYHIMELSHEINDNGQDLKKSEDLKMTPKMIFEELSKRVIGQEEAKKVLAVSLYNHYKKINQIDKNLDKSNILMVGPSGTGKTLLAKTMADIIKVPFAIVDATVYTEAGYVGEDVENMLLKLLQNANFDKQRAEKGIIFIDEIDKIARKGENISITRDVSGEGVQNSLLKILEGCVVNVPPQGGRKHPYQEYLTIDTTNILFICAGAFEGLEITQKSSIGILKREIVENNVTTERLTKFGLIPELLGRLPIIVNLRTLKFQDLKAILSEPKNAIIRQYQELLKIDNIDVEFSNDALDTIANLAIREKTGARSLRRIIEKIMLNVMFNLPTDHQRYHLIITSDMIKQDKIEKLELQVVNKN